MQSQPLGIDSEILACFQESMAKRAVRHRAPEAPADTLQADVVAACERIHELAKQLGWDLKKLGKEAGRPFQSFENWKKGHQLPKIANLQDFARAVGANVRLLVQDAEHPGGLGMASTESRMIAALIDGRLSGDENTKARKQAVEVIRLYLGTLPHP